MFIDTTLQGWRKSKRSVCDVARHSTIIPVILKEENIALMSVRTNRLSEKRLGSVNIVENHLLQTRHLPISVVHGSVELAGQRLKHGHTEKNFSDSASSAVKSFGNHLRRLKGAVNFVLVNVRLILSDWVSKQFRDFMVLEHGIKRGRGYLRETIIPVNNVVLTVRNFMSTILSTKGMVGMKMTRILSRCVRDAISYCIGRNSFISLFLDRVGPGVIYTRSAHPNQTAS